MANTSLRVALAGWGLAGRYFHAPFIATTPGLELTAVATSRRPDSALFPGLRTVSTFEELLHVPGIDLIIIATPNRLHISQARAALQSGYHVVVEKPVAPDANAWKALTALAAEQERLLVPFHNRRWDGDFLTVSQLLKEGRLGPIHFFASRWPRYRPRISARSGWKERLDPTHGVLYDLGSHLIDQVMWLFGEPQLQAARVASLRPGATNDDWMRLWLDFSLPGAGTPPLTVLLEVDLLNAYSAPRFELRGRDGTYFKHGLDPQEDALRAGGMPGSEGWGKEDPEAWGVICALDGRREKVPTLAGDYGTFYRALYKAIVTGEPPPVSPEAALKQLRFLETVRQVITHQP